MNITPLKTANGDYTYDTTYDGIKLRDLVQELHAHNCKENGWSYNPLKTGCYGFDNLAVCLGYVLEQVDEKSSIDDIADMIHKGWIINYEFWKTEMPWLKASYIKPAKPLNDERRNLCAATAYEDLPKDEKDKDIVLARWIYNRFFD
jgi:hypothetical protein